MHFEVRTAACIHSAGISSESVKMKVLLEVAERGHVRELDAW